MTHKIIVAAAIASSAFATFAQEDVAAEASDAPAQKVEAKIKPASFHLLPAVKVAEGTTEVLLPNATAWELAEEGRHYPLGARYRVANGGHLVLQFGNDSSAVISGDASFETRAEPIGSKKRTVVLDHGEVRFLLAANMPEGAFSVAAPGFSVINLVGESKVTRTDKGDGDEVVVRCVTGSLAVTGRHFNIPKMSAADEVRIRSSHDYLHNFLYGTSGDYVVKVDRGVETKSIVQEDGSITQVVEPGTLDWHLSPNTKLRIDRMRPSLGERLSVTVMAFDAAGELKSNFSYAENRAEVNSGELVKAPKEASDDAGKSAAAETTEETVAADVEDEASAKSTATDNNESNEQSEEVE